MPALIERCHAQGLYLIARLVCFRDPAMGELRPEWMNQKADGSLFKDNSGMSWINPYKRNIGIILPVLPKVVQKTASMKFSWIMFVSVRKRG